MGKCPTSGGFSIAIFDYLRLHEREREKERIVRLCIGAGRIVCMDMNFIPHQCKSCHTIPCQYHAITLRYVVLRWVLLLYITLH